MSVSLNEFSRKSHGKINHVKKGKDVVVFRLFDKKSLFLRPHSTFSGAFNYISESNYIRKITSWESRTRYTKLGS